MRGQEFFGRLNQKPSLRNINRPDSNTSGGCFDSDFVGRNGPSSSDKTGPVKLTAICCTGNGVRAICVPATIDELLHLLAPVEGSWICLSMLLLSLARVQFRVFPVFK